MTRMRSVRSTTLARVAAVPVQIRPVQLLPLGARCRRLRSRRQEGIKASLLLRIASCTRSCGRTCADGVILLHAFEQFVHVRIPLPAGNLGAEIDILPTGMK